MLVAIHLCGLCKGAQGSLINRARLLITLCDRLLISRSDRLLVGGLLISRLSWLLVGWLSRLPIRGLRRLLISRLLIGRLRGLLVNRLRRLLIRGLRGLLIRLVVWLSSGLLVGWLWLRISWLRWLLVSGLLTIDRLLSVSRLLPIDWLLLRLLSAAAECRRAERQCARRTTTTSTANKRCSLAKRSGVLNAKIKELCFLACRKIVCEHLCTRYLASNSSVKSTRLCAGLSLPK